MKTEACPPRQSRPLGARRQCKPPGHLGLHSSRKQFE
jgi:hypothetical protein